MQVHEFDRESKVAEALLCEVARQRQEPAAFVFRQAAEYCSAVYQMWYYESGRARKLDDKVKELERRLKEESEHHQWFENAQECDRLRQELANVKKRKGGK